MIIKFDLPPGLYKNGTEYESMGRFYEADLWRWFDGAQRPIGGWRPKATGLSGKCRACLTWVDNSNQTRMGIGSNEGLFVVSRSGTVSDITPASWTDGPADAVIGGGYGEGDYGEGTYGTPRPDDTNIIPAFSWSLDTWGAFLVGTFGSRIYEWQLNTATPAAIITNSPTAEAIVVTEERIMLALGSAGDPRAVAWCDAEDNTDWTPSGTNLAGGKRLQTNGSLLAGKRIRGGVLLWTDTDVHRATYEGLPLVYRFERLATGCGAISSGAMVSIGPVAYWMGPDGFWTYDGDIYPLQSDLSDFLFRNINRLQASKVRTMHNSSFGEIWWFYPSSTSVENDRVCVYNYREKHWNDFALSRLSGIDRGVFLYPQAIGNDGVVYEHEVGNAKDGRQPYALSGPVELGNGEREMEVHAIIPDSDAVGDVAVSFTTGDWTLSPDEVFGPFTAADKTDCRFQARRVAAKFTALADKDFRVGDFRFEAKPGAIR